MMRSVTLPLSASRFGVSDAEYANATACYREGLRQYHTLGHAGDVLVYAEAHPRFMDHGVDRDAVRRAVLWHDAVYVPGDADNERRSADRAVAWIESDELAAAVTDAIMSTTHDWQGHRERTSPVAAIVADADLAGLAEPAEVHRANADAIRAEFAAVGVTDKQWRAGRSAWITQMLERRWLFTDASWEAVKGEAARANLRRELADLG
ncbi:MAG: hypothetical protein AAGK09_02065 [Planctomycetota bacterium]